MVALTYTCLYNFYHHIMLTVCPIHFIRWLPGPLGWLPVCLWCRLKWLPGWSPVSIYWTFLSCLWQSLSWWCWSIMGRRRYYVSSTRWRIVLITLSSLILRQLIQLEGQEGPVQWSLAIGLWYLCVWEKAQIPGQAIWEEHPECCDVWLQVWWGVLEGAGLPPEPWQLSARSGEYQLPSLGKAITTSGGHLVSFLVYFGGHLGHCIYLRHNLYVLTSLFLKAWWPLLRWSPC